jgi:hypothetical protein
VSSTFFEWFRKKFGKRRFSIEGPERAGRDIYLNEVFNDYPKPRPIDFIIRHHSTPLILGFIRYDSDRGGAQEDDRTSGYRDVITDVLNYSDKKKRGLKILFVNEGPGLVLGSMWDDYSSLEGMGRGRVMVATLKMLDKRLTKEWMLA